jgi:hypothetical protein
MPVIPVPGVVSSVIDGQYKIIKFWETETVNGKEFYTLWTAWFTNSLPQGIAEGDFVELGGRLGKKVGTYTPKDSQEQKQIVELSLNDSYLINHQAKNMTNSAPVTSEDTPF